MALAAEIGHEAAGGDHAGMSGRAHGHAMGDMAMGDMGMPGGLPMADRGPDRDGLRLDQLHVPLGPVLPDCPGRARGPRDAAGRRGPGGRAGGSRRGRRLVLGSAGAGRWPGKSLPPGRRRGAVPPPTSIAWAVSLLSRAGTLRPPPRAASAMASWPGRLPGGLRRDARRFTSKVARSRTLAWLTGGLGGLSAGDVAAAGVRGPALRAAGDVTARYRRWCAELADAVAALDHGLPLDPAVMIRPAGRSMTPGQPRRGCLPYCRAAGGYGAGRARLIVASLYPDLDELPAGVGPGHGH